MRGAVLCDVTLEVSVTLSIVHFIISIASTAMIMHVMLIDKKLDSTLRAIDLLHNIRPYASVLVLACVAVYLWDALLVRVAVLQLRAATATAPLFSLGSERDEA